MSTLLVHDFARSILHRNRKVAQAYFASEEPTGNAELLQADTADEELHQALAAEIKLLPNWSLLTIFQSATGEVITWARQANFDGLYTGLEAGDELLHRVVHSSLFLKMQRIFRDEPRLQSA